MATLQVGTENSTKIELYYEDHGEGQAIVLVHGYPQSSAAWERQLFAMLKAGHRVIAYDRRGFGRSSQPATGYEYDTFAADLHRLLETLDLHNVVLVGHSMGTGEVIRYIAHYGEQRIAKVVCISPIAPFTLQTEDNPDGLPQAQFDLFQDLVLKDRLRFLAEFYTAFYHSGLLKPKHVSDEALAYQMAIGSAASPIAMHECIPTWHTDFRSEVKKITVPTLIVQGTADKVLPIALTGQRLNEMIAGSQFIPIEGASHGLLWTHADEVNRALINFVGDKAAHAPEQSVA